MKLIKGNIYTGTDRGERYIWMCDKDGRHSTNYRLHLTKSGSPSFQKDVGSHRWDNNREPTYEERAWIEACIAAGELVPEPKNEINYEIY